MIEILLYANEKLVIDPTTLCIYVSTSHFSEIVGCSEPGECLIARMTELERCIQS